MKTNSLKIKYLIFKAQQKDPDAFAQIYDIYIDKIYRYIYFKISVHEEAQDLTSEAFLKVWHEITKEKKIENFNALIYRISRNLVIDHLREKRRGEISFEEMFRREDENENLVAQNNLFKQLDQQMEFEKIHKALWQLKDEYREAVILRYIDQYNISEIAKILDKKKGATKVLIHRGLKNLKQLLQDEKSNG